MIIVQTPLRVSFFGGGTDFEGFYLQNGGGQVLSTAIDKYTYVLVKKRIDDTIYLHYSQKEAVENVNDLKHELVRESMKLAGVEKGVEISTFIDVREGTGLGSSSSITVGLLHALYTYKGELKTAKTLADQACQIEINVLGKPMGRQDQYIAAYGDMRQINFNRREISVEGIGLSDESRMKLSERLMLFFTNRTRKAEDILTEQKANIADRAHVLKEMKGLASQAKGALLAGEFDDFGAMLDKSWQMKKQLASKVSDKELDDMYKTARDNGALGGKITGAGGGGFLLVYCPNGKKDDVRSALRGQMEIPFQFERDGSKVVFNYRR